MDSLLHRDLLLASHVSEELLGGKTDHMLKLRLGHAQSSGASWFCAPWSIAIHTPPFSVAAGARRERPGTHHRLPSNQHSHCPSPRNVAPLDELRRNR